MGDLETMLDASNRVSLGTDAGPMGMVLIGRFIAYSRQLS